MSDIKMGVAIPAHTQDVSTETLADIMDAGLQGVSHWATVTVYKVDEDEPGNNRAALELTDGGPVIYVDVEQTKVGIERLLAQWPRKGDKPGYNVISPNQAQIHEWVLQAVQDDDATMVDSDCGDAIIQLAAFGRVVYR